MGPTELLGVPLFQRVFEPASRVEKLVSYDNILSLLEYVTAIFCSAHDLGLTLLSTVNCARITRGASEPL